MAETSTKLGRVSLVPRGEYDATETYNRLDIVEHEGSSYLVLADGTTGVTPAAGTFYMLVAEKGDTGATGPIGATGPQGIQGEKGDTGDIGPAGPKGDTGEQGQKGDMGETGPAGPKGDTGDTGNGIASIERTSGTGAAGTTDTYTITMTDGSTATFQVYNGADGTGAGDMLKSVYDPQNKNTDIFSYVDKAVSGVEINVDADPTEGSPNPVSSGGTFSALATKQPKLTGRPGQAVGFAADGAAVAVQGWSNPSLLLNGDFRRPVNRNGQTEYAGARYAIDRWYIETGANIELQSDGIAFTPNPSSFVLFAQKIENYKQLIGKMLTLSVLIAENTCDNCLLWLYGGTADNFVNVTLGNSKLYSVTMMPNSNTTYLRCGVQGRNSSGSIKIIGFKLELGTRQTLAHQDADGSWVLNDPPDYDLQYALCGLYSPITGKRVGNQHSNPNLLDNWYFADPVNQNGEAVYTGGPSLGYGFDRWCHYGSGGPTFSKTDGGISVDNTAADKTCGFVQIVESERLAAGETYTLSALVKITADAGSGASLLALSHGVNRSTIIGSSFLPLGPTDGYLLHSYTFTLGEPTNGLYNFRIRSNGGGTAFILSAMKLEPGPIQTLARQDADGGWALNDPPPNQALELAKCQRYYQVLAQFARFPGVRITSNTIDFLIPLAATMRANPKVVGNPVVISQNNSAQTDFSFEAISISNRGCASQLCVRAAKNNHGLTFGSILDLSNSGIVALDANL